MEDLFKDSEHFEKLSVQDRLVLTGYCSVKKVPKDQVLFKEGEIGKEAYIVKKGLIQITKKIGITETATLAVVKPGMVFGEMAVFRSFPRYADAVALAESELIVLSKDKFGEIREQYPQLALYLVDIIIKFLGYYLRKTTDRAYGLF